MRLIIPLLALVLGVGTTFWLTQFGPLAGSANAAELAEGDSEPDPEPVEYGAFAELDGIVVNPAGTDGRRYLMIKVGVEAESEKTLARLDELKPAAVDAVIGLLSAQPVERLVDITKRDSIKAEVHARFDEMLGEDGPLSRIYFTQYVMQ